MISDLRVHFEDEGVCIAILRNALLVVWRSNPTVERVRAFRSAQRIVAAGQGSFGGLTLMAPHGGGKLDLGEDLRREFVASMTEFNGRPASAAVVVEGEGFAAAAVRAISSGITLMARPKFPMRTFATRRDAARWLAPLLARDVASPLTEDELLAGLEQIDRRQSVPAGAAR